MIPVLLLRKISGIIGWMKSMDLFSYPNILFHLDGLTTPNQVWTKPESIFEVQDDDIRVHQLENELFSLSPRNFDSIEGLFTKFN